jgi:sulfite reductase (ferredoxin)
LLSGNVVPEEVKLASRYLRGPIAEDLADGTTGFSPSSQVLLKFHGVYQQDDRDQRRTLTAKRETLAYSCMVRAAIPGGVLSGEQYLMLDEVADSLSNATMRITTRQGLQYHFVAKDDLRTLIASLNERLVSTLAACGDVVRNVMACTAPIARRNDDQLLHASRALATRFRPETRAYWELWVDGEQAVSATAPADEHESVYGVSYLPRKFKIGFAWPGDNCVDVFTNDLGIVPSVRDGVDGYVLFVGGGLGMSHAREEDTYPRLATPLAWVAADELGEVAQAVVVAQRDLGNRSDRHRARLKYTIDTLGEAQFRAEVEQRLGRALIDAVALHAWHDTHDHLGWFEQPDGRWFIGVHVDSGRVADTDDARVRTALREVVQQYSSEVRFTARQDVLLCNIDGANRADVERVLTSHGVALAESLRPVHRLAVACPALPTCGQALGEAERVLNPLIDGIHGAMSAHDVGDLPVRINMTGCPNGCARPYSAEIGIVGRTKTTYDLYVGGAVAGDRLAERIAVDVKLGDLPGALAPLFERYRKDADDGEGFGDYCHRVGVAELSSLVPVAAPRRRSAKTVDATDSVDSVDGD